MDKRLIVAGLALTLGGCHTLADWYGDKVYGVIRSAPLASPPDLACVQRTMELTDGIAAVSYHPRHEGKGLFHPTPWVYDFFYNGPGSDIWGSLQLVKTYDGHFSYRNTHLSLHQPPRQEDVEKVRPVMRTLERNLATRCGMTALAAVHENCIGVVCQPLSD